MQNVEYRYQKTELWTKHPEIPASEGFSKSGHWTYWTQAPWWFKNELIAIFVLLFSA